MRIKAQEETGNSSGIEFFLHKKEETRKFRILNNINIPDLNFRNPELFWICRRKNLVSTMVLGFCTLRWPSLPLCCMYATLSRLQCTCQYPLCSLQTCKSLYLPWQNQLPCSDLAHRLSTSTPILRHQVLPRRHFQSCLQRMPPTPHTTLKSDRTFQRQLARLPRHWPLYCRIYDLPQWRPHRSHFYHANTDRYVNLRSRIYGRMLRIYGHSTHMHATLQHDIPRN